jgi:hypothetical protein
VDKEEPPLAAAVRSGNDVIRIEQAGSGEEWLVSAAPGFQRLSFLDRRTADAA